MTTSTFESPIRTGPTIKLINCFLLATLHAFIPATSWAMDDLSQAALAGQKEKILELIAKGTDVKGQKGGMALSWAALMGKYEVLDILISHDADVNYRDPLNGLSPLHKAVSYIGGSRSAGSNTLPPMDSAFGQNKKKFAEILISRGADVNAKSKGGITPLHEAGSKEIVELLLAHGARIESRTDDGNTPLFGKEIQEVAEALIAHGADANSKNEAGNTPLHFAIITNNTGLAKLLVAGGADVNVVFKDGLTPTSMAAENNNSAMAELFMTHGGKQTANPKDGVSELHWAASNGNQQLVEQLLARATPVNAIDKHGRTPLNLAVENNHKNIARLLIARGAGVNVKSKNGMPLVHGIRDREMMALMLESGADVTLKNKDGNALLSVLIDNKELIELVLLQGADIDVKNESGNTALHLAARGGWNEMVKTLLAHKANANIRNDLGRTPLFEAVSFQGKMIDPEWRKILQTELRQSQPLMRATNGNETMSLEIRNSVSMAPSFTYTTEAIKVLLANGADAHAKDRIGEIPLHIAPNKEIVELFLAQGISVDAKRNDGATTLHLAALYGRTGVAQALLAHGANVNARTANGTSPLHYAKGKDLVSLLLAGGAKVDAVDSEGNTPLYMADEPSVAELLIARGATVNVKNKLGQTPSLRAVRTLIKNLLAPGLSMGPLGDPIVVAHGGSLEVIKVLVRRGADLNLGDGEINTQPQNKSTPFVGTQLDLHDKNKTHTLLYYVKLAKADRDSTEVLDELRELETFLVAHGAK